MPQVIGCPGVLLPREFRGRLWPILTFDSDRGSLARLKIRRCGTAVNALATTDPIWYRGKIEWDSHL